MLATLPAASVVPGDPAAALVVLFALLIGHAIADFPLQGEFLARAKNRHSDLSDVFQELPVPKHLWFHALTAHCLVHAGAVWLITGSVALGAIELCVHWAIDLAKCENRTSFTTDQILHVVTKVVFVVLLYWGPDWVTWNPA